MGPLSSRQKYVTPGFLRRLWLQEIEYRAIVNDRARRYAAAVRHSRKVNLQYTQRRIAQRRTDRVKYLCTPEGRMEEARRIHGLNWKDPAEAWGQPSPRVGRMLLGLGAGAAALAPTPKTQAKPASPASPALPYQVAAAATAFAPV